jgi:hypothetical protein
MATWHAAEASRAIVAFGYSELRLRWIFANTTTSNRHALALARTLGMRGQASARDAEPGGNTVALRISERDWRQRPQLGSSVDQDNWPNRLCGVMNSLRSDDATYAPREIVRGTQAVDGHPDRVVLGDGINHREAQRIQRVTVTRSPRCEPVTSIFVAVPTPTLHSFYTVLSITYAAVRFRRRPSRSLRDNYVWRCTSDETATLPRTAIEMVQRSSVSRASCSSCSSSMPSSPATIAVRCDA